MKKAKTVEIPADGTLTYDEYKKLAKHAINSASWHAINYRRNSFQIREKLRFKGYRDEDVTYVTNDKKEVSTNIIEDTINFLIDDGMLDDERLAEDFVYSSLSNGKNSLTSVRNKMMLKLFPKDMIDQAINNYIETYDNNSDEEALNNAASKIVRSGSFYRLDSQKKNQKFVRTLVSKGFNLGDIINWKQDNEEFFTENEDNN